MTRGVGLRARPFALEHRWCNPYDMTGKGVGPRLVVAAGGGWMSAYSFISTSSRSAALYMIVSSFWHVGSTSLAGGHKPPLRGGGGAAYRTGDRKGRPYKMPGVRRGNGGPAQRPAPTKRRGGPKGPPCPFTRRSGRAGACPRREVGVLFPGRINVHRKETPTALRAEPPFQGGHWARAFCG